MHLRTDEVGNGTLARRVVGDTAVAYHHLTGIGEGHGCTCGYRCALYHLRTAGVGSTDGETVEHGVLCSVEVQEVRHIEVVYSLCLCRNGGDIGVGVAHFETRARILACIAAIEVYIARNVDGNGTDTPHYRGGGIVHRSLLHIHVDSGCRCVILVFDVVERICQEAHWLVPTASDRGILRTAVVLGVYIEVVHRVAGSIGSLLRRYRGGARGVGTIGRTRGEASAHHVEVYLKGWGLSVAVEVGSDDTLVVDGRSRLRLEVVGFTEIGVVGTFLCHGLLVGIDIIGGAELDVCCVYLVARSVIECHARGNGARAAIEELVCLGGTDIAGIGRGVIKHGVSLRCVGCTVGTGVVFRQLCHLALRHTTPVGIVGVGKRTVHHIGVERVAVARS